MGNPERRKAKQLVHVARNGVINNGHLRIYEVIDKLRVAAARLDGAKRRELLFKCGEITQALDAKVDAFAAGVRDPAVEDRVAIVDGVFELLSGCMPIYHALKSKGSFTEACNAFDAARAALGRFLDEEKDYHEGRKLNGGRVRDRGKRVTLNAKAFAEWQARYKRSEENFKQNPYAFTAQTTEAHIDAVFSKQKTTKRKSRRQQARTKKARVEEPPPPKELEMRAMADGTTKYKVTRQLFKFAPAGVRNLFRPMEEAMELVAKCLANRPAGTTREEQRAARAQEGRAHGVKPDSEGRGYIAMAYPKKKTRVWLEAPGGGCYFASAKAAGEAIEKYEKAGSPTTQSHPLVRKVYRY